MPEDPGKPAAHQGIHDLEEMWAALLEGHWDSLAVIPTDHRVSSQLVLDALRKATGASANPVEVIDAREVDVAEGKRLAGELASHLSRQARAVVVVDSLIRNLSGIHLVQGVQAILLVVRVGGMDLDSLTSTVAMVGAERIIGSVTAPTTH